QAEDGIRDFHVTGVQTCALPICLPLSIPANTDGVKKPASPSACSACWPGPPPRYPSRRKSAAKCARSCTATDLKQQKNMPRIGACFVWPAGFSNQKPCYRITPRQSGRVFYSKNDIWNCRQRCSTARGQASAHCNAPKSVVIPQKNGTIPPTLRPFPGIRLTIPIFSNL